MIIANEDSAYLAALYGGREITKRLNAKVAEVTDRLAQADDFVEVGGEMTYHAATGILRVVRDDREVEEYVIDPPPDGYWSGEGFRVRSIGQYTAIALADRSLSEGRRSAEGMFDWPIYRVAMSLCTGGYDTVSRTIQHDGDTCPIHEGGTIPVLRQDCYGIHNFVTVEGGDAIDGPAVCTECGATREDPS